MQPHKLDYFALFVTFLFALGEMTDYLPVKAAGPVMMLVALTRIYVRLAGQQQAMQDGQDLGKEIKTDIQIMDAKKPQK